MKKVSGEWLYSPEPFSVKSKMFNTKLIEKGTVKLEFDLDKTDKYGRILAYVFVNDGKMANAELIKNGLATVYTFYPNVKYFDLYTKLQKKAISERKGLWSELEDIAFGEAFRDIGEMRNVHGTVSKVYVFRNYLMLDFMTGNDSVFTAQIPLKNIPLFKQKGIDPFEYYLHKSISITGKIKGGPSMYVDNPLQIKLEQ